MYTLSKNTFKSTGKIDVVDKVVKSDIFLKQDDHHHQALKTRLIRKSTLKLNFDSFYENQVVKIYLIHLVLKSQPDSAVEATLR